MGPRCLNEILFIVFAVSGGGMFAAGGTYVVLYHLAAVQ